MDETSALLSFSCLFSPHRVGRTPDLKFCTEEPLNQRLTTPNPPYTTAPNNMVLPNHCPREKAPQFPFGGFAEHLFLPSRLEKGHCPDLKMTLLLESLLDMTKQHEREPHCWALGNSRLVQV